ncbi:MAG: DNA polymerase III subunit beta [Bryobacterales bacterium]|nr:DNA polymerase III subunit beta [Bryobacterales bacterium]MDE0620279.1 DNA polymerase III subunit beta [Bryobacterales bacterium]
MELTARVQALVAELQLADAIIDRDQPRNDLIHLEVVGDALQFTSQGHSLLLRTTCPVEVVSGGAIAVPMRRLLAYLQLFPADTEMRIAATETDTAKVTLVRSETRIPGLAGESYDVGLEPRLDTGQPAPAEMMPEESVELPADLLLEALNHTIFSVADEQSHYTIEGAQLIVHRDKIGMVSTDGHRLSLYLRQVSAGTVQEDLQCLISRKAMSELKRILEQCEDDDEPSRVEFAVDERQIYFQTPRRLLVSQRLGGRFPEYNRVMPKEFNATLDLDKETFAPVLRRVSLFSERRSSAVRFDIENGEMKMQAQVFGDDADMLHSEESISVDYAGDPIRVGFNARYILDFMQICTGGAFRLHIGDPRSAALMEIPDKDPGTDYRYVLMPIRV